MTGHADAVADPVVQAAMLAEAVEHAPFGFVVFDEWGKTAAANEAAAAIVGRTRSELLSARIDELMVDPGRTLRRLDAMLRGERHKGTTTMRRPDGSTVEIGYRAGATRIGDLPFLCIVAWPLETSEAPGEDPLALP